MDADPYDTITSHQFPLSLNDYQSKAKRTAVYPDNGRRSATGINYTILGLTGEAGELANVWKKAIRDGDGVIAREKLRYELGDVLWYIAVLADELGITLDSVAQTNLEKLRSRRERKVLHGSGDNR